MVRAEPMEPGGTTTTVHAVVRNLYQCGSCLKQYSKLDHLARHVRSHTKQRPYQCETCNKCFGRIDLLRRHSAIHASSQDTNFNEKNKASGASSNRVSQACHACATLHLKCDNHKPCNRCLQREVECTASTRATSWPGHRNNTHELISEQHGVQESSGVSSDAVLATEAPLEIPQLAGSDNDASRLPQGSSTNDISVHQPLVELQDHEDPGMVSSSVFPELMQSSLSNVNDVLRLHTLNGLGSGARTPRHVLDFGLRTDFDLDDMDLSSLEIYNHQIPFVDENTQRETATAMDCSFDVGIQNSVTADGLYRKSLWKFVPALGKDHGAAEHLNLLLPDVNGSQKNPVDSISISRRITSRKLDLKSRDRVLAIVLRTCDSVISRSLSLLPSVDLLDGLVQYFLTAPFSGASSWIHTASFVPADTRPELLAAMAAAGAVLAPDASLRKLGFAFQEIIRLHIPTIWENDNTEIRDLQLSQAYMIQLEIGMWSGNSRKTEIAESFQQPLLTMLRRGGVFGCSRYQEILPSEFQEGAALDSIWKTWVEQESLKRLAYHLLQHDVQTSMALFVPPLISYAELKLPLPETDELWTACDAQSWKAIILARPRDKTGESLVLLDYLADVEMLENSDKPIDKTASQLALLHAIWGMVWEYRQISSLQSRDTRHWDDGLLVSSRYHELARMLQLFCVSSEENRLMMSELIFMHLHLSLDQVQLFAGMQGPMDAQRVYPDLRKWISGQCSRQAIWHAGQVVQFAKTLPRRHIRGFQAIALYQAGLTFWVYGRLRNMVDQELKSSPADTSSKRMTEAPKSPMFWIDDEESADTRKFIARGRGTPALHGHGDLVGPAETSRTMLDVVLNVMRYNHGQSLEPRPPLVENLIQLIEGLRDLDI